MNKNDAVPVEWNLIDGINLRQRLYASERRGNKMTA